MRYAFGPWEPDSAGVDTQVLTEARNVYALKNAYGPIPTAAAFGTTSLPSQCVGMAFARPSAGGWQTYAGTRTDLYKLVGDTWTSYTRTSGGSYAVPVDEYWSFIQYGSKLIAANLNDDVQVIDVDTGAANFSALGGSPPKARYVGVVGDFLVLAALASNTRKVRNSAINDSTGWTVGTDLCDEQEFADGGRVTGLAGGEFGYVVQEKAIRRMMFQPGQDTAFRFERIEQEHGAAGGYSLVSTANGIFFISDDGFYSFSPTPGPGLVPIGSARINQWFKDNSDPARFFSTIAFNDPYAPRVAWAFYNSSASTIFDRLIIYDWKLDRWTYAVVDAQFWASFATSGTTLEQLDVYGDIDSGLIPYPFDSRVWEGGRPVIGLINSSGGLSFLEGTAPLTALLRSCPIRVFEGRRALVSELEPLGIYNHSTQSVRVGRQENSAATVSWTAQQEPYSSTGIVHPRASARILQFELEISQTLGTLWTHAQGFDVIARDAGRK